MTGYNNCCPNGEHERDRAQAQLYASLPMTATSESFFQVIHAGDGKSDKQARKKTKSKAKNKVKKPDSQTKVKHFFQTKVNEDGYPMKMCEYEPTERRHVYRPPGYGDNKEWFHDGSHCTSCHLKPCVTFEFYSEMDAFFFEQNKNQKRTVANCATGATKMLQKLYCKIMKRRYLTKEIPPACIRHRIEDLCNYVDDENDPDTESCLSIDTSAIDEFCKKNPKEIDRVPLHIFYKNKRFRGAVGKSLASVKSGSSEGDSVSDSEKDSDDDDDDFPLSILRDHQEGDQCIEEKIAHYRTKKAQQTAVFRQNSQHTTAV
jgi:hypothetical protein